MSSLKIVLIASTIAAASFSQFAIAGETNEKTHTVKSNAEMVQPVVKVTALANTAVLSSSDSLTPVVDQTGEVFYNKFVPISELQENEFVGEVVDTYTYEYQGRKYTNKVVK